MSFAAASVLDAEELGFNRHLDAVGVIAGLMPHHPALSRRDFDHLLRREIVQPIQLKVGRLLLGRRGVFGCEWQALANRVGVDAFVGGSGEPLLLRASERLDCSGTLGLIRVERAPPVSDERGLRGCRRRRRHLLGSESE